MKLLSSMKKLHHIRTLLEMGLNPFAMQETKVYAPLIPAKARRKARVSKVRRGLRAK